MAALGLSDKQLALRRTGIGASEIAAIAGLHPTRRPIDVWAEKVGAAEPFEGNAFTEWGHRLERAVAEAWQDRHPDRSIFTPGTLRHREHAFAFASPDRIVVPPRRRARDAWEELLEIKNVSLYRADEFGEGEDEIPEHMLVQVQWQLEVADLDKASLVPLIGGHDYREYPIPRDRELGALLLEIAARFWIDLVEKRVAPPVDGSGSYAAYLRRRFPAETGPVLEPTPETEELVRRLREARSAEKAAKKAAEEAAQAVKAVLGEAAGIAGLCTWKANRASEKVEWESAARNLAVRCGMDRAAFDQFLKGHVVTAPGVRVLRLAKEIP